MPLASGQVVTFAPTVPEIVLASRSSSLFGGGGDGGGGDDGGGDGGDCGGGGSGGYPSRVQIVKPNRGRASKSYEKGETNTYSP